MVDTVLQHSVLLNFVYPFLLVFLIIFAVLEKSNLLGEGRRQINALVAFVIGLIFVSAVFPKMVVANMVLFLAVAIVMMFVVMLLWGFIFSGEKGIDLKDGVKWALFGVVTLASIVAILWATGVEGRVFDWLFRQSWSESFWTNLIFIVLIGVALGWMIKAKVD